MHPTIRTLLLSIILVRLLPGADGPTGGTATVVIYGGTPAGVCAAVAAARQGATVTLIEPLPLIGGVMASGLSFSDSNQCDRRTLGGLFVETHRRIADDYRSRGAPAPYNVDVKDQRVWTYEPQVAERVFSTMLRDAGVRVITGEHLTGVVKDGTRLTALTTTRATYPAAQFIDATYEGDLMAAAKVTWVLGRESKARYGESLAGQQLPKPAVPFPPRDAAGVLLPLVSGDRLDPDVGDRRVMAACFRLVVTNKTANRIPFTRPERYDPAQFELARRMLAGNPKLISEIGPDLYAIPGGKFDANNGIRRQISTNLFTAAGGSAVNGWMEATPEERQRLWQLHQDYHLGFWWFLQNDPVVPESARRNYGQFGLPRDEFTATGHWPPWLYIREGRRLVGEQVLTQRDVLRDITKPDSIAISSFPIDSHDCQRVATGNGGWINEGTIYPVHMTGAKYGQPHQVPYRCVTPRRAECTNLLVPVCLSASHVALSSIRVEPTWMVLGESCGIAAARCAALACAVQDLPHDDLRARLIAAKVVVDLRPEHLAAAAATTGKP